MARDRGRDDLRHAQSHRQSAVVAQRCSPARRSSTRGHNNMARPPHDARLQHTSWESVAAQRAGAPICVMPSSCERLNQKRQRPLPAFAPCTAAGQGWFVGHPWPTTWTLRVQASALRSTTESAILPIRRTKVRTQVHPSTKNANGPCLRSRPAPPQGRDGSWAILGPRPGRYASRRPRFARRPNRQSCRFVERGVEPKSTPQPKTPTAPVGPLAFLAERQGFEPWVPARVHLISSQARSTAPAPLRCNSCSLRANRFLKHLVSFEAIAPLSEGAA